MPGNDFLRLTARLNLEFFDSQAVRQSVDRAKRKSLSKGGAFVRRRAKSSIRKRKGSSLPGRPPSSHAGHLKRLLFFAWDSSRETVFVGPIPFARGVAPELLEHGGIGTVQTVSIGGEWDESIGRFRDQKTGRLTKARIVSSKKGKKRRVVYQPRPFMLPALEKEVQEGTIPKAWANAVRR